MIRLGTDVWMAPNKPVALVLALLACFCWGTCSNSRKAIPDVPFPLFYCDYTLGACVVSWLACFTLGGGIFNEGHMDLQDLLLHVFAAAIAGCVSVMGNVLVLKGIEVAGLAIAYPFAIGTALVLGTILTYLVDPQGNLIYLISGVFVGFLAVLANAKAAQEKEPDTLPASRLSLLDDTTVQSNTVSVSGDSADIDVAFIGGAAELCADLWHEAPDSFGQSEPAEPGSYSMPSPSFPRSAFRIILICVAAGVFLASWNPINAWSIGDSSYGLTPYSNSAVFTSAQILAGPLILRLFVCFGFLTPVRWAQYFEQSWLTHFFGFCGGAMWICGSTFNFLAGDQLGFAVAYPIACSSPVVATLWGLLWYKEFKDAPRKTYVWTGVMFLLYATSIALISLGTLY
eukprot:gb/GEZN01007300.1/.p1 GENE.gb/GEZN01007300.1/~~gb/GEZN01007300.1/.p1  ORF type:complete len:400 (-),score=32.77 gb/GEZN01007300.1/:330-1529(-)